MSNPKGKEEVQQQQQQQQRQRRHSHYQRLATTQLASRHFLSHISLTGEAPKPNAQSYLWRLHQSAIRRQRSNSVALHEAADKLSRPSTPSDSAREAEESPAAAAEHRLSRLNSNGAAFSTPRRTRSLRQLTSARGGTIHVVGREALKAALRSEQQEQRHPRIHLSHGRSFPTLVMSVLAKLPSSSDKGRQKEALSAIKKKVAGTLRGPRRAAHHDDAQSEQAEPGSVAAYNPHLLYKSAAMIGSHRQVLALNGYRVSLVGYMKKRKREAELNAQFQDAHDDLYHLVPVTKVRKTKAKLFAIALLHGVELATLALSFALYERLVFHIGLVTPETRKLYAAVCMVLAVKFDDHEYCQKRMEKLFGALESHLDGVSRKDILAHELKAYSALDFTLFLPPSHLWPHLERIQAALMDTDFHTVAYPSERRPKSKLRSSDGHHHHHNNNNNSNHDSDSSDDGTTSSSEDTLTTPLPKFFAYERPSKAEIMRLHFA